MELSRRKLLGSLLLGGTVGMMSVPALARSVDAVAEANGLAEARLLPWEGGSKEELHQAHAQNPEYDLMSRTFLSLALADLATENPRKWRERAVLALDEMILDTQEAVDRYGQGHFLLPYATVSPWKGDGRSLFVDGEMLMMMAIRRLLMEEQHLIAPSRFLAEQVQKAMSAGPILCAESYPDECWTFCNTLALAALRMMDRLEGTDHRSFCTAWCTQARKNLLDPKNGLLISSFRLDGSPKDGPEGSTLWLSIHMLQLLDPAFAQEQYRLARTLLGRSILGMGYAREWPSGALAVEDVDSGPIVPWLEASPSSSGLALLAARSAHDEDWHTALRASLQVAAFPEEKEGRRKFRLSNAVGDAVILAGLTAGPFWKRVKGE